MNVDLVLILQQCRCNQTKLRRPACLAFSLDGVQDMEECNVDLTILKAIFWNTRGDVKARSARHCQQMVRVKLSVAGFGWFCREVLLPIELVSAMSISKI